MNLVNYVASIYYKRSLFNAHTKILIVYIFINVNKLCLNQTATMTTTTAAATTMNLFRSCYIRVTLRYLVTGVTRFSPFLRFVFCMLKIHVATLTVTACCVAELRWSLSRDCRCQTLVTACAGPGHVV